MSEDAWRPLPIWAADHVAVDVDRIKVAKAGLWVDWRVLLRVQEGATIFERVLAWGSRPPFLCEYALVTEHTTDDALTEALAWVLGEAADDRGMTLEDALIRLFGPGVREIPQDELDAEAKLLAYQSGAA